LNFLDVKNKIENSLKMKKMLSISDIPTIKDAVDMFYYNVLSVAKRYLFIESIEDKMQYYLKELKYFGDFTELNTWAIMIADAILTDVRNESNIIRKAKSYILQNYSKAINLSEIADFVGVSTYYLSKTFQKECDIGLINYLTTVRIEAAIRLINEGELKLYEIASAVGYSNYEHFSRVFKKEKGKSPKEYGEL
jgi:YesN/AraC family two-component response regulator